ncbi:hypothetical protein J437_LFUL016729 [Ladona fulva]|uniref:Uncharacterized protein n=1 Tax=Ladona fulva TaxID=123851 RepID=A0A8K0P856_LADFU|nr:hypothetical protein J437_LFUL016729 [Ladona fulva]
MKQLEKEIVELAEESHFLREELRKGQRESADMTARLSTMLETATKEVASCRKDAEDALMKESRAREEASKACEASREAKERMNEAVKKADVLEAEKEIMKQELETQREKFKDLISRIATLEKKLADAEIASDRATKSEKLLVENLAMAQKEWEKEKVKLKDFYQSQVEELVKTKVNEFQNQLDAVEQSLRKEAETREEDAKKLGEERLRMLNEKHSQEVNLLEQKHAEEISLWNLRLKRVMEEMDSLKQEVSKHNSQKAQLAKGLHSLMQAQLRQGLRLIASGGEVDQDTVLIPPKKIEKVYILETWH